jgi:undecaprenyl diphosphate synthase
VAIIMDGNGRWARERGLPRLAGHRQGAQALKRIVEACPDLGVGRLTLFAFSTENWKRPSDEVSGLMELFRTYLRRERRELIKNGVRIRFIGDRSSLDADLQEMMAELEAETANLTRLQITVAINYGGRMELTAAARRLAAKVASGEIDPADITEDMFGDELETAGEPDPDLLIRTSGEQRLSNFLPWQSAYSELVFAPQYWPDFDRDALQAAISDFCARDRRYGALSA